MKEKQNKESLLDILHTKYLAYIYTAPDAYVFTVTLYIIIYIGRH